MRIEVRSRAGNAVLGIFGVLYVVAALALLVYLVQQTRGAASLVDHAVAIVLLACAAAGVLFIVIAAQNLGPRLSRRATPPGREGAATVR